MKKIMVIDDNVTSLNIVRKGIDHMYVVYPMLSGEKALKVLKKNIPDLILLDIIMPEMNGFKVLTQIKELGEIYNQIPVIFVTASKDANCELEGFKLGAVDFISKPFSTALLLKRIELHLKQAEQHKLLQENSVTLVNRIKEQTSKIEKLQYSIVHVLSDLVERRDGSTGKHLIRTSEYLKVLLSHSKELQIYDNILIDADIELYSQASKLHDLGKVEIPDGILLKDGKLTDVEFEIMKSHATKGEIAIQKAIDLVGESPFLMIASNFISSHHEKWNGGGYPRGLKGEEIPICGRLMAIADVYDALISKRVYKKPFTHQNAVDIILEGNGTHFDPVLIEVFKDVQHKFNEIAITHRDDDIELDFIELVRP